MSDPVTVLALHLAPATRLPMREVQEVVALTGQGLTGDRYEKARHRHVTVQSASALAEAEAELGRPVPAAATRRNVTLSHGEVPTAPGTRIVVGDLVLEVVRVAAPCKLLEDTLGPGAQRALRRRAGTVFRVVQGGTVRRGDLVTLDPTQA